MLSVLLSFEILFAISFVLGLVAWAISPGPKRGILIAVALLFGGSFLQKLWWAWGATGGLETILFLATAVLGFAIWRKAMGLNFWPD